VTLQYILTHVSRGKRDLAGCFVASPFVSRRVWGLRFLWVDDEVLALQEAGAGWLNAVVVCSFSDCPLGLGALLVALVFGLFLVSCRDVCGAPSFAVWPDFMSFSCVTVGPLLLLRALLFADGFWIFLVFIGLFVLLTLLSALSFWPLLAFLLLCLRCLPCCLPSVFVPYLHSCRSVSTAPVLIDR
jgi:hypothetical protein